MYRDILFDLDGTLTDPGEGITNSVAYALEKYGIKVHDKRKLYQFIGPPLHESFGQFFGFSEDESMRAVEYYREYYREKGIFENIVYGGVEELLQRLSRAGRRLFVATSKPEPFARQILEHFALDKYFVYVAGANMDGSRTKKAQVIAYAMEKGGIADAKNAVMVGDRCFDVLGARECKADCIGVLYGYGDRAEFKGAVGIAGTPEEVGDIILGNE